MNPLFFQKALFRTLFKLIRKHGIALVLQGLIEFAETDKKDPKMQMLAKDMKTALDKYKNKSVYTLPPILGSAENMIVGARVRCIRPNDSDNRTGKTGVVREVKSDKGWNLYYVTWDDGFKELSCWGSPSSFEVFP